MQMIKRMKLSIPWSSRIIRYSMMAVWLWLLPSSHGYAYEDEYDIIITKSRQELAIKKGEETVRQFRVATGMGGGGSKRELGDKKTPVGIYKIIDFKGNSKFHYFMQIDYPNLLDAWYGYKNSVISASEFKKIALAYKTRQKPPQDTRLGGYIGIHGLGEENNEKLQIHKDFNWTDGCIALTNEQINELKQYVAIGTKVIIKE